MVAEVSARNDRVPCPEAGCGYSAEPRSSIAGHVAMAHRDDACVRDKAGCGTHDATWNSGDERCSARGGRAAWASVSVAGGDEHCVGSNHFPGCEHFPATPADPPAAGVALLEIPLDMVDVGSNVRVTLEAIDELAASIAEHGVLQPVKASRTADGRYRLLWGQRRVLAARMAGLATVPAIVSDDVAAGERPIEQLVENLHRADLNPIDRATAMRAVVDGGISQADLARKLGVAPSTVSNDLRILTLAEGVVEQIRTGAISASHGKAMASLPPKQQQALADRIVGAKLSAKDLERELEWKRQEVELEEARAKRTEKVIPKAIAALEAAAIPKNVELGVGGGGYSLDIAKVEKALRAAGNGGNSVDKRAAAGGVR